ncbi:putative 2OG-Fe(II) oxygenase [Novosphingobium sp. ZN18A2]|uniref:2OG-Fe(II) oxygenase family protein n=1 Tax=Novosphingobium sp. ZN18A2 TaxID=3079861 RepID=UPI0030CB7946
MTESPTAKDTSSLSVDQVLRMAIDSQKTWDERDAIAPVRDMIARHPDEPRLHQMLGVLYRALDENAQALHHFDKAARLAPDNPRIAYAAAQVRLDAGLPAAERFERALALAPQDKQALLGYVAALLEAGEAQQADRLLEDALVVDPGWADGHAALVRLRWQGGQGDASWRSVRAAAESRGDDVPLWRELILGLMHAKKFEVALAEIAKARRLAGADIFFDSSEAGCLDELGRFAEAERIFLGMGRVAHAGIALRFTRHLLKAGRPQDAAAVALVWTAEDGAQHFWPYIATAWRMTDDPRWQWLEGDPRLTGVYDITADIGSLDELAAFLRRLHQTTHQPLEQSLRGGTQTNGRLFARIEPEVQRLRQAIVKAVERHAAQLPPMGAKHPTLGVKPKEIRFAGSWSVRLTGEGHHAVHMHPEGWFSSAFYVALPENMDAEKPEAGWLTMGDQPEFPGCPPAFRAVRPEVGRLALFPSTMWHGTKPITGGERMTVAFDIARGPGFAQR